MEIWQLTATELRQQISKGEISAREATESHLSRMNQVNGKLNAVIESCETEALQEADLLDDKRHKGDELVEHLWNKIDPSEFEKPPKDWVPKDKKLRLWNEGSPKPIKLKFKAYKTFEAWLI